MALEGIDFAWYKPTVAQLKALGASWIAGYLSDDATKNLTAALVAEYLAAGVGVVTVWETTSTRATAGYSAGQADARAADAQRAALGLGPAAVLYFAVDEDTTWPNVSRYFDGVISVLGTSRVGAYGDYTIVEGAYARGIRFCWQTVAWSNGAWSSHACIRQPGGTLLAGQADVDQAETLDFGQWPRPSTTPTTPPVQEDDMPQWINGGTNIPPGPEPLSVGVPAGTAWPAYPHRTLHLHMDKIGDPAATALVRVGIHKGGPDWDHEQEVTVTAKGKPVDVDLTGAVKVSLQTSSPGVGYSIETW